MTPVSRALARPSGLPGWLNQKVCFLGVLLVVFAVYTEMAFGMEWRTEADRIGAGFFPRIVGVLALVTVLGSLYRELRGSTRVHSDVASGDPEPGQEWPRRHPGAVVLMTLAAVFASYWFMVLGAIVTGALFLLGALWFLDPHHRVRAVVLAVTVPVGMYLVFQTGLNAGLPDGVLPMP
ncbi:MAG: tripartite tricarboxylate transporter TctB family protein [Actinomycetia bacterium]|nr:tripartite tricarboxylate transporter TctB family protein [Actinomycetes bacterium]